MPHMSSLTTARQVAHAQIAKLLDIEPSSLPLDATMLSHPKWDSFAHLEIMLFLQKEKGIEINEETLNRFSSLANIMDMF